MHLAAALVSEVASVGRGISMEAVLDQTSPTLLGERAALLASLRERSVIHQEQEHTVVTGGKSARWMVDTRVLLLDPSSMRRIALLFLDAVREFGPFQLACMEMTGIPLMVGIQHTALSQGLEINGLIVRKERKKNGRMRAIEGTPNSLPVIFVDDLLNTASTFAKGVQVLRFHDLQVALFWALVDFNREEGSQRVVESGCPFITEYQLDELGLTLSKDRKPDEGFPYNLAWQHRVPEEVRSFYQVPKSVPVFGSDCVFYGAENACFYALDQVSGKERWKRQVGRHPKGIFSSPLLVEDTVLFGA